MEVAGEGAKIVKELKQTKPSTAPQLIPSPEVITVPTSVHSSNLVLTSSLTPSLVVE